MQKKKLACSETSTRNHLGDSYDAVCVADERKTALTFCEVLLSLVFTAQKLLFRVCRRAQPDRGRVFLTCMKALLTLSCWVLVVLKANAAASHNPVVLLPGRPWQRQECLMAPLVPLLFLYKCGTVSTGLAGSVLEAKLDRKETPSWYCSKEHDWEVEWLSLKAASRPDCLLDELTVQYDPDTRRSATACNDRLDACNRQ